MAAADLQGPLDDFRERMFQIRSIIVAIETAAKSPGLIKTSRANIDVSKIGTQTGNTVNAMSLIFLASSFEEFIREEISQCAGYMIDKYAGLKDETRHGVRSSYWIATLDRLKFSRSILTKKKPKIPDSVVIGKARALIEAAQGFVINDDAKFLDPTTFAQHSNNFRPHVVNEIALRLGISEFIAKVADTGKIRSYFGVSKKSDAADKLRAKLDEFYDRRNETVHSLNSATGYAVDVILDYLEMFELAAESAKNVFAKELGAW
ncbi:HEPN domain-containing protein [Burkholderia gladioli pv. alliicola]|uniref:HEPN domain-containing protein n=1 Tax=Burkholderia gladioli TaxID=28095 RepID=UPI003D815F18